MPQPSSEVDKHKLDTEGGVCCLTSYSNNTPADTTSKELRAIRCSFFFFLMLQTQHGTGISARSSIKKIY